MRPPPPPPSPRSTPRRGGGVVGDPARRGGRPRLRRRRARPATLIASVSRHWGPLSTFPVRLVGIDRGGGPLERRSIRRDVLMAGISVAPPTGRSPPTHPLPNFCPGAVTAHEVS